jgi:hypothetical protein
LIAGNRETVGDRLNGLVVKIMKFDDMAIDLVGQLIDRSSDRFTPLLYTAQALALVIEKRKAKGKKK